MSARIEYIGWNHPLLDQVVRYLVDRFMEAGRLDLNNVVLVTPGGRAGRQLQQRLAAHATSRSLPLLAATTTTIGSLPEKLYQPQFPFADELTQSLAWVRALRSLETKDLSLLAPGLVEGIEDAYVLRFADSLIRLHHELTGELLTFQRVLELSAEMPGFPETDRWRALVNLQEKYLALLDAEGFWDLQTARLRALENEECNSPGNIILVGTADINGTTREMLHAVASSVTSLVFSPPEEAHRFDSLGCLLPAAWQESPTSISHSQFLIAEDPGDEARLLAQKVASFDGQYAIDQITIGIPDESMGIPIAREFQQHGVAVRVVIDRHLSQTTPFQLLAAIADYLQQRDFPSLARLIRQTDICSWLSAEGVSPEWVTELDDYHQSHLPRDLKHWMGNPADSAIAREAVEKIDGLLSELGDQPETPGHWGEAIARLLQAILQGQAYDETVLNDRRAIESLRTIRPILSSLARAPAELASRITAQEAIRLVLRIADREAITSPFAPEAIELLGWLELPLDTAQAVIVTSFNDGFVPKAVNAGLFLPDSFRRHLEINDNQRRFARDAYALCLLQESGRDVTYICRKRNKNGDPIQPSRLALTVDGDDLARRVLAFWKAGPPILDPASEGQGPETRFQVPKPSNAPPLEKMRVTAFRDYIDCPYRFYLRHVLGLGSIDDSAGELDGMSFGTLLHDILRDFGESPLTENTDCDEIRRFLFKRLTEQAQVAFGPHPRATVDVQLHQARLRLKAFAEWQATRALGGWNIHAVEIPRRGDDGSSPAPVQFVHNDTTLMLTGRIDRIDHHPESNTWAIFDYKTGDAHRTPEKVHVASGEWIDLQLPLYRHLAAQMGLEGTIQLGFIVLPKDTAKTGELIAEWTEEELQAADDKAAEVWQAVVEGKFWEPHPDPRYQNGFELICQQDVFERRYES
jgi:hypothetical protein